MPLVPTLSQLDIGCVPDHVARATGHLGYAQWLGPLQGNAGYFNEAMRAYALAQLFVRTSPAVAAFCHLVVELTASPLKLRELKRPAPARRGGAKAHRDVL